MAKRLPLIIGVVLAILAALMVKVYLDQQKQRYDAAIDRAKTEVQESPVPVLVVNQDIPQGKAVDPTMFEVVNAPASRVPPQAVSSMSAIAGMAAATNLTRGEPLTYSKLIPTNIQQPASTTLAMTVPAGKRAITISVDNISGIAGMIKPGDYVDVLCLTDTPIENPESTPAPQKDSKKTPSETVFPLFQNILVLAKGQELTKDKGDKKVGAGDNTITLALTPQEASLIAFVQEQGKIRLILRSPQDSSVQSVPMANWEALLEYLMPEQYKTAKEETGGEGPKGKVEIYRGLEKQVVPLSR